MTRATFQPAVERRGALDGMRAFAILAVFASHTAKVLEGGWIGVELFFVLSGYLITGLLIAEWSDSGRIRFRLFYARRALRLYPALLAIVALGVLAYSRLGDRGTLTGYGRTAAAALLYVQDFVWGFSGPHGGFGHTWSLAVEEQFYLLWPPALYLLLRRGHSVRAVAGSLTVISLVLITVVPHGLGTYFLPWTQAPLLLAGCALAAWRPAVDPRWADWLAAGGGLALVAVALAAHWLPRETYLGPLLVVATAGSCALVAGAEATGGSLVARVIGWSPFAFLGRISYGFYLYYLVVIEVLEGRHVLGHRFNAPLLLVITLACAFVSFYVVERPFLRLKRRFEPPRRAGLIP